MAPPRRTSVRPSKSWAGHLLLAAGSIWSCHCFADLWDHLFSSPDQWVDYRANKKTERFPDFKREKDGKALWIDNEKTPAWVQERLNVKGNLWKPPPSTSSNDFQQVGDKLATSSSSTPASSAKEHLWQDLIDSPHKWEDFRTKKRNPRFPDFKRKEDGIALWFDSYDTPDWVATNLMEIEDKFTSSAKEHLWQDLIDSPQEWEDFRTKKRNPRFPDFKRKEDGIALWFDSYDTPDWVATKLMEIEDKFTSSAKEHLWQDLIDSPHKWEDFRTKKRNPRFPDFKRKEDGIALWFDSYDTPDWVATKLMEIEDRLATAEVGNVMEPLQSPAFSPKLTDPTEIERLWKELLQPDVSGWLDYRKDKKLGRYHSGHPDFFKDKTREGLWCDDTAPEWAIEKLKELDAETDTQAHA